MQRRGSRLRSRQRPSGSAKLHRVSNSASVPVMGTERTLKLVPGMGRAYAQASKCL
jgi:hypothetical protein